MQQPIGSLQITTSHQPDPLRGGSTNFDTIIPYWFFSGFSNHVRKSVQRERLREIAESVFTHSCNHVCGRAVGSQDDETRMRPHPPDLREQFNIFSGGSLLARE